MSVIFVTQTEIVRKPAYVVALASDDHAIILPLKTFYIPNCPGGDEETEIAAREFGMDVFKALTTQEKALVEVEGDPEAHEYEVKLNGLTLTVLFGKGSAEEFVDTMERILGSE